MVRNWQTEIVGQLGTAQRKLGIIPAAFIPNDGALGTVLTKLSATDYDCTWAAVPAGLILAGNGLLFAGATIHFAQAGAYTPGAVAFATGAATMGFDAANLFWDDATNRLGLGTNAPTETLDVNGTGRFRTMTQGSVLFAGVNGVVSQDNTNLFWDNTNKYLGINTNVPISPVHINRQFTDVANHFGYYSNIANIAPGASAAYHISGRFGFTLQGDQVYNQVNELTLIGLEGVALYDGRAPGSCNCVTGLRVFSELSATNTGTCPKVIGIRSIVRNYSAVNVTEVYGALIETPILGGGIGTYYGLKLEAGAGTNLYGVYQSGSLSFNYFAGDIEIGVANFTHTVACRVEKAYAESTINTYGFVAVVTETAPANSNFSHRGAAFDSFTAGGFDYTLALESVVGVSGSGMHSGTGTCTAAVGGRLRAFKLSTGPVTNLYGATCWVGNSNAVGVVASAFGLRIFTPAVTGVITNYYGVYLEVGAGTNKYGLYQAGTTDSNWFAGYVSIGTYVLAVNRALTITKALATTGNCYGVYTDITNTATGASGSVHWGIQGQFTTAGANNYTYAEDAIAGLVGSAIHNGTGTCTWVTGVRGYAQKLNTGVVAALYGGRFKVFNNHATGAVSVGYGLHIGTPSVTGAITTYYGLYLAAGAGGTFYGVGQNGAPDLNYFEGHTAFGSTAPVNTTFALFGASTTAASSLRIVPGVAPTAPVSGDIWSDGTDVWFRNAAGVTKQFAWV